MSAKFSVMQDTKKEEKKGYPGISAADAFLLEVQQGGKKSALVLYGRNPANEIASQLRNELEASTVEILKDGQIVAIDPMVSKTTTNASLPKDFHPHDIPTLNQFVGSRMDLVINKQLISVNNGMPLTKMTASANRTLFQGYIYLGVGVVMVATAGYLIWGTMKKSDKIALKESPKA